MDNGDWWIGRTVSEQKGDVMQNILESFEELYGIMDMAIDRNLWAERLTAFQRGWVAGVKWQSQVSEKYKDFPYAETLHGEKDENE
jgi:hypothetical protein